MNKTCKTCKQPKDISEFRKHKTGKFGVDSNCRICSNLALKKRRQDPEIKRKGRIVTQNVRLKVRQKIADYLKDKSCIECGENRIACLHFHHRDETTKEFSIAQTSAKGYGWDNTLKEIDKCDILCANCHAVKTSEQFNWYKDIKL